MKIRTVSVAILAAVLCLTGWTPAWSENLSSRIQKILARPEFRHSLFGIEFYSLDKKKVIYSQNADKFFVAASTTKLITSGSALELLGPDYQFHTKIYRTGEIDKDGILQGDLILVASGDPNLSGRIQPDKTLAFENEDHSYGGDESRGIGDPLMVIRELAGQIAEHHIKRVAGRVLVDASLFPQGDRELGTGVVMSPIVVNDNVVDVLITPGASEGAPAEMRTSPLTSYVRFVNQTKVGKPDSLASVTWASDVTNGDGSQTVTVSGNVPANGKTELDSYAVADPQHFAEVVLVEALNEKGIVASARIKEDKPDFASLAKFYDADHLVAEHVSPPLTEEVKVMLKVSQNLHASNMPYLLSALVAHKDAPQAGFDLIHDFLSKSGLDLSSASQGDGAGGSARFTPDFMVKYLVSLTNKKYYPALLNSLPILGKDGTLAHIQEQSPAAGHVFAKTGTWTEDDPLNQKHMVVGKGLAGYITTAHGEHLAFAVYAGNVAVSTDPDAVRKVAGQVVGELAAAAYDTRP